MSQSGYVAGCPVFRACRREFTFFGPDGCSKDTAIPGKLTLGTNLPSDARPPGCRGQILPDRIRSRRPAGGYWGGSTPRGPRFRPVFCPRAQLTRRDVAPAHLAIHKPVFGEAALMFAEHRKKPRSLDFGQTPQIRNRVRMPEFQLLPVLGHGISTSAAQYCPAAVPDRVPRPFHTPTASPQFNRHAIHNATSRFKHFTKSLHTNNLRCTHWNQTTRFSISELIARSW